MGIQVQLQFLRNYNTLLNHYFFLEVMRLLQGEDYSAKTVPLLISATQISAHFFFLFTSPDPEFAYPIHFYYYLRKISIMSEIDNLILLN